MENLGIDDGAESKFGTHKELIVLNILKYIQRVNMSRDHFAKNRKLLSSWWPFKKNQAMTFFLFILHGFCRSERLLTHNVKCHWF